MVVDLASRVESEAGSDLLRLLEVAGSALPMDALFADMGGVPSAAGNASTSDDSLLYAAVTTFRYLTGSGESAASALTVMRDTDPVQVQLGTDSGDTQFSDGGRGDRGLGAKPWSSSLRFSKTW